MYQQQQQQQWKEQNNIEEIKKKTVYNCEKYMKRKTHSATEGVKQKCKKAQKRDMA